MKKIALCFLMLPFLATSQNEKTVKTQVHRAVVYQQGAMLTSTETVSLSSGMTNLIFEGVAPNLNQNSLQASGKGDFVVVDVRYNLKYEESKPVVPQNELASRYQGDLKAVQDSLTEVGFLERINQKKMEGLNIERGILLNNKMMKGDLKNDSLALFKEGIAFLRQKLSDIDDNILKLERAQYELALLKSKLNTRQQGLYQLINGQTQTTQPQVAQPIPQIIVSVMAENPCVAQVSISYLINAAGWTASYDLKASKENQNVDLKHRAIVYQNSGINWKDVALVLSTGNPNESNVKPVLQPFYLAYDQIRYQQERLTAVTNNSNYPRPAPAAKITEDAKDEAANYSDVALDLAKQYVTVSENMLRVEYEIKLKYTIDSDNKPRNVIIQSKTLPATYNYTIVPKLDPDAFLMARVTAWEDLNLIPGEARIYFDGAYIGVTQINPRTLSDTLQLNLGRDKSIVVTRTKLKDKSKESFVGDTKTVRRSYEISIRNNKNTPIRLIVEDQMPISSNQDIKVEYIENSDAKFNDQTGKLIWDLNIKSKDSKRLQFTYEVKHPKTATISNL